ncbi:hydroxyethylthiazole kinase [Salix suchowensis]|nr:hydroxyethylthiazole kinase [Salix suchowensis]
MGPDNNFNAEQDQNSWALEAWTLLSKLRGQLPLIQCIANFVSMDLITNTLLSAAMREASQVRTTKAEKPRFLDPVAAGASGFRLKACFMGLRPINGGNGSSKYLGSFKWCIVIVSGAVDIITDGHQVVGARNGVPMIQKITATGQAAASALSIFGIAGEMGMDMANGPASLYIFCIWQ